MTKPNPCEDHNLGLSKNVRYCGQAANAVGFKTSKGHVKIAVTMPEGMFAELKRFASKYNRSLASQIREYVATGTWVDDDMEKYEADESAKTNT